MPWNEESVMSQRQRLIEEMLLEITNIKELCERLGISRKTAYKWLSRYSNGGLETLRDQKRTPHHQPNKTTESIERTIVDIHKEFPYWGPYKLQNYLKNERILKKVPSHPTIGKILERNNCVVIRNNKSNPTTKRFERDTPNDLWQMDFKGSFMTECHRCYPLTILDDYSRFSIGLKACENEKNITVKAHLTDIFMEFGLPNQINVDNGNPWGSSDLESNTSLMIWLIKLGVRLTHSAPYHPQTNGKDERFHRTLKLEVLHNRRYKHCQDIQRVFDAWSHIYNYKRPHQGINNQTPHMRYHRSLKKFPNKLLNAEYDSNELVRRVTVGGLVRFNGRRFRVGKALTKEFVAIRETSDPNKWAIFFMDSFIKKIALEDAV